MSSDVWQVMINEQVYEADVDTLKSWVADGYVQPTDKIRKGNLSWTEARNVPILRNLFQGGAPVQAGQAQAAPSAGQQMYGGQAGVSGQYAAQPQAYSSGTPQGYGGSGTHQAPGGYNAPTYGQYVDPSTAAQHLPHADYMCRDCSGLFMKDAVKFVGSVGICPSCGGMCVKYAEVKQQTSRVMAQNSDFGGDDMAGAFTFPLKDPIALTAACILYGFLGMGGFIGWVVANGILFGAISRVIRRVSDGHTDGQWMPEMSSFWDDFVHPALLGLGVSIISFGPMLVGITIVLGGIGSVFMGKATPGNIFATAGALAVVVLIGLLWAVFYYPMALLVAGFTQNFGAVLNPLVGFDTMKRMGRNYFMAFGVCLVVLLVGGVIQFILNSVLNATGLVFVPLFGKLASNIVEAVISFYTNLVIAYLLGRALFKSAANLGIE
ncbi:MAG: DUF4013 domain-containing protein [Blastocatellia bacterium]|nr:DUF4013 domain-containing protein [Blastocatellia bacterium]